MIIEMVYATTATLTCDYADLLDRRLPDPSGTGDGGCRQRLTFLIEAAVYTVYWTNLTPGSDPLRENSMCRAPGGTITTKPRWRTGMYIYKGMKFSRNDPSPNGI